MQRRTDVLESLYAAVNVQRGTIAFELIPIRERGRAPYHIAILRPDTDVQIVDRARTAAARWVLTPRQTEVLELVSRGLATATVAAILGVSERAVELHVTAIFDRVGVDSRAALINRVLAGCRQCRSTRAWLDRVESSCV